MSKSIGVKCSIAYASNRQWIFNDSFGQPAIAYPTHYARSLERLMKAVKRDLDYRSTKTWTELSDAYERVENAKRER